MTTFKTASFKGFAEKHRLKTSLSELNLPDVEEVNSILDIMVKNGKSEVEICVWFQTASSWLRGEKPIKYLEYADGDYLVYAAQQYVAPVMHG